MERLLTDLLKQTQENSGLLQQALAELHELKQQVQNQKKFPFTVKTCGFEVVFQQVQFHNASYTPQLVCIGS